MGTKKQQSKKIKTPMTNTEKKTRKQPSAAIKSPRTTAPRLNPKLYKAWQNTLLEKARIRHTDRHMQPEAKIDALLSQEFAGIERLWQIFNIDRDDIGKYLGEPKKQATSYLMGFHLPNVIRAQAMLGRSRIFDRIAESGKQPDSIELYDLGCGTGALTSAFLDRMEAKGICPEHLHIHLADPQGVFLDTTKSLIQPQLDSLAEKHKGLNISIKSFRGSLFDYDKLLQSKRIKAKSDTSQKPLKILLLGYVWNEVSQNERNRNALKSILEHFFQESSLVALLEPANQNIARRAMELRDEIVEMGWQVNYPCPKSTNCPMLERTRDWCYSEFTWEAPKIMKKIDKKLGIDRSKLSVSAYLFSSPPAYELTQDPTSATRKIIVGRPIRGTSAKLPKSKFPNRTQKIDYLTCDGTDLSKDPSSQFHSKEAPYLLRGTPLPERPQSKH